MTTLQMVNAEQNPSGRLVFVVGVQTDVGRPEFPISIQDSGTPTKNEDAVLRSAIDLAVRLLKLLVFDLLHKKFFGGCHAGALG